MRKLGNVRDIYKSLANFSVMYNGTLYTPFWCAHQKQNKYSHRVTPSRLLTGCFTYHSCEYNHCIMLFLIQLDVSNWTVNKLFTFSQLFALRDNANFPFQFKLQLAQKTLLRRISHISWQLRCPCEFAFIGVFALTLYLIYSCK